MVVWKWDSGCFCIVFSSGTIGQPCWEVCGVLCENYSDERGCVSSFRVDVSRVGSCCFVSPGYIVDIVDASSWLGVTISFSAVCLSRIVNVTWACSFC